MMTQVRTRSDARSRVRSSARRGHSVAAADEPVARDDLTRLSPRQASRIRLPIDRALDPSLFRALADETRIRLLGCIIKCGRACTVSEIAKCCSVDLSVVSRHLKILQDASLLSAKRAGREVWYTARSAEFVQTLRQVAQCVEACGLRAPACCGDDGAAACCDHAPASTAGLSCVRSNTPVPITSASAKATSKAAAQGAVT